MNINDKQLQFKFDISKPDIPTTVILNCDKAKKHLGWEVSTSIEEGLRKTSEWYKKHAQ